MTKNNETIKLSKVSIIVPMYNAERYIESTIESIINQSYKALEIILVNDGSTDKTYQICSKLALQDKRIRVIDIKNQGVSNARNIGILASNGTYLQFVDSDDYLEESMVEKMVKSMELNNVDMVICGFKHITLDKEILKKCCYNNNVKCNNEEMCEEFMKLYETTLLHSMWNKLFKREIIISNKIFCNNEWSIFEDLYFNIEALKAAKSYMILNECLYQYVQHNTNSLMKKYNYNIFEIKKETFKNIRNYFVENNIYEKYKYRLEGSYVEHIIGTTINEFNKQNKIDFKCKIKRIKEILNDVENKKILYNLEFENKRHNIMKKIILNNRYVTLIALIFLINIRNKLTRGEYGL